MDERKCFLFFRPPQYNKRTKPKSLSRFNELEPKLGGKIFSRFTTEEEETRQDRWVG